MKLISRAAAKRLGVLFTLIVVALIVCWFVMIRMPGRSYRGPLSPLTTDESTLVKRIAAAWHGRISGASGRRAIPR